MRASGILLPVASLPSKYGIGAFSEDAYRFVDMLKKAGQSYWQILPLGPTGYGDSPYQSFSTFAGNPYFISLEDLIKKGWLKKSECEACDFGSDDRYVDYAKIYLSRYSVLRKAYKRSNIKSDAAFVKFCEKNKGWLNDYALYMVLKTENAGKSWSEWDDEYRLRGKETLKQFRKEHKGDIRFQKFLQFLFYEQWGELKAYANKRGIQIIGDIPIYVAFDSADAWAHPELFQFDADHMPKQVAGCPPDAFSATGQLWGNPLYDWKKHKETGYQWWIQRIEHCWKLYDVIRIDHFRGFDEYYAIPFGDATAENGHWEKGPGMDIFQTVQKELGQVKIIAEDLGFLTDSVLRMVEESGFPGMKVLEFAFDSREPSNYLPHNYGKNCVVYTGTHDNETLAGWYEGLNKADRKFAMKYMGRKNLPVKTAVWEIIRMALASTADTCIIPIQDYLVLGNEARINHPSTLGGNWMWRLKKDDISKKLLKKVRRMTALYGRLPGKKESKE
ncbi:MAG: 4-alpha-glucanotransferase [Coprococcus sp.]|nr:4-alpha-glucanotransferase [Coprococcus sp.]